MDEMMTKTCLNYNPFNLVRVLSIVMSVMIERRLAMYHTTTKTHLQCEVRLNELMKE